MPLSIYFLAKNKCPDGLARRGRFNLASAAAGKENDDGNNYPPDVGVAKEIAKTVIHKISPPSSSFKGFLPLLPYYVGGPVLVIINFYYSQKSTGAFASTDAKQASITFITRISSA